MKSISDTFQTRCDVLDGHRQAHTVWADHEGWSGFVMADVGWHVGSPTTHSESPRPESQHMPPRAAIIVLSYEHRGNDCAFPARVTNLHGLTHARSSPRCRGNYHDEKHGHIDGKALQILTLANHQKPLKVFSMR